MYRKKYIVLPTRLNSSPQIFGTHNCSFQTLSLYIHRHNTDIPPPDPRVITTLPAITSATQVQTDRRTDWPLEENRNNWSVGPDFKNVDFFYQVIILLNTIIFILEFVSRVLKIVAGGGFSFSHKQVIFYIMFVKHTYICL